MSKPRHVYFPASIMSNAWRRARHGARRFGGTARLYLAAALRQAWAEAKDAAARIAAMRARVLAEVEAIRREFRDETARRRQESRDFYAERRVAGPARGDGCPDLPRATAA